ncbi:MAG: tetratricopeptide repeat protein [Steroidobacteraceae bacterium]
MAEAAAAASMGATDAYSAFHGHFDAGRYGAAVPYARRVLELAEKQSPDPTAEDVQVALMNLATSEYLADDYVAAEASFLRAIELVQSSGRPLNDRLARAYGGLASAYHDGQRHDLAVKNFEQAVGLTRRHDGLLTERQLPLLEQYVDSLTELGRYQEALQGQRYILRIVTRKYGENSVELAPTLEKIGRWYANVGAYDQSRRLLKQAMQIVETAEGPNSLRLVPLLAALAACDRQQLLDPAQQVLAVQDPDRTAMFREPGVIPIAYSPQLLLNEGEKSLLRAVQIAEDGAETAPLRVVEVRTQLGDWYQSGNQPERALPHYQRAWTAASRVTALVQGKSVVEALYGQPVLLQLTRPDGWKRYAERQPEQIEVRNVIVQVTVNAQGRVEKPQVLDDSGDPKRAERTVDALKSTARYRPRIEGGDPVPTQVTFSQPWTVLLPPPESAPAGATTDKGQAGK